MTKITKTTESKVPFYKKAIFPWAIIVLAFTAFFGFAVGIHTERQSYQAMQQQFENGVASVKK